MNPQYFDYWMSQANYIAPPHQTTVFEIPPDVPNIPSLTGSPISSYDQFSAPVHPANYTHILDEQVQFSSYSMPMTPPDFGSDHDSSYYSPRPPPNAEPVSASVNVLGTADKTQATSGRRRAQNRAAQRAFRERKERYARNLETQLSILTDKYNRLEASHSDLNAAYDRLRKTIELMTQDDDAQDENEEGKSIRRRSGNSDIFRKLFDILNDDLKDATILKAES